MDQESARLLAISQSRGWNGDIFLARLYLLWFLTEEETMEEFGLAEATADGSNGTIVCSTMMKPPEFKELTLTSHILSEGFKT